MNSSRGPPAFIEREFRNLLNNTNNTTVDAQFQIRPEGFERFQSNISMSFYSLIFVSLFGSVTSITAGTSLWILLRKKERKKLTDDIVNTMTTDDEKLVMRVLEENNNELTQKELAKRTKLSKVKVHRVVKRLETMGLVSKYSYGMTNKIKLNGLMHKEKKEK